MSTITDRDPDEVEPLARLILRKLSTDPTPEDAALATVLAILADDIRAIRRIWEG